MRGILALLSVLLLFATLTGCETPEPAIDSSSGVASVELTPKESLGKLLFFDPMLSTPPGQACSHCHSPDAGFGDPNQMLPVSRGVHPDRYGNRNDMTATYAAYIPPLTFDEEEGIWVGGLFWDGRAASLADQAKGPPLNPLEMANPDAEAVVASIREASYRDQFLEVYGEGSLDEAEAAYDHMADAIAAYEMTAEFRPFDSKYDLYLAGEASLTPQELLGLALFEDESKGNCAACHPSQPAADGTPPLFTDFTYDNLGTPKNPMNPFYLLPPELNPDGLDYVDLGLGPVVGDPELNGFFRVPTLRNVAVTPPYMHNGVFHTLFEVVSFYNTRDVTPWPDPEVATNVNRDELGDLGLTPDELEALVAFLETLTDGDGQGEGG
jgi:cytochrome c peroxidase